jgi:hypothetical protein
LTRRLRLVATGAIVGVMALIATTSPAAAFTDVKSNHPFRTEITWAANNDIVNGYPDDTFRGSNQVTRQAASAFLFRFVGNPSFVPTQQHYVDVPPDHAFYVEIEWMRAAGLGQGYGDGTYKPGSPVTRQAMAAFLWRIAGAPTFGGTPPQIFNDVPTNHPFYTPILWVWDHYIADGYTTPFGWIFKPSGIVTRQAAAAFIYRFAGVAGSSTGAERSAGPDLDWEAPEYPEGVPVP